MNIAFPIISLIMQLSVGDLPNTYVTDPSVLLKNKNEIRKGDTLLINAKDELVENANTIITKNQVYSVTFKDQLPPSRVKNDFLSLAPYWWPDENKTDGMPYVHKDGQINPESQNISDIHMVRNLATDIRTLGLAYFYTNDEQYVNWINKLLYVFFIDPKTKMRPNFKYAQIVRGREIRGSITISAAAFISMIEGIQMVESSRNFDKEQLKLIENWFSDFVNWMMNDKIASSERKASNNIGVYYTLQIVIYNLFIGNDQQAKELLKTQGQLLIDRLISSDGRLSSELKRAKPWSYVNYTVKAFDQLVQLSENLGVDLYSYSNSKGGNIEKMYQWLVPYAIGEKKWEYSNEKPSSNQFNRALLQFNNRVQINGVRTKPKLSYIELLTN